MLVKLLSRLNEHRFSNHVVSIALPGTVGDQIRSMGISVSHLGFQHNKMSFSGTISLVKLIRKFRPDILQTWMYHADLLGLVAAKIAGTGKVIWNIRTTRGKFSQYKWPTFMVIRLCCMLSRFPNAVIVNSHKGMVDHRKLGYSPKRFVMIPNGFDLDVYKPSQNSRKRIRTELLLTERTPCVGFFARFDPIKGHRIFLQAAKFICKNVKDTHFIFCGHHMDTNNVVLNSWIKEFDLENAVHLLGHRDDISDIMAAMDTIVSCSFNEGFSNVIGEAMACGIPCVVTHVGDSAQIVGKTGKVIPSGNPVHLARAVLDLLTMSVEKRKTLGNMARERIGKHYALDEIVNRYKRLYVDVTLEKHKVCHG